METREHHTLMCLRICKHQNLYNPRGLRLLYGTLGTAISTANSERQNAWGQSKMGAAGKCPEAATTKGGLLQNSLDTTRGNKLR